MENVRLVNYKPNYYMFPGFESKLLVIKSMALGPDEIIKKVCAFYDKNPKDVRGKKRHREFIVPRYVSIHIMHTYCGMAAVQIGRVFHRDHTTVLHALKAVQNWVETGDPIKEQIEKVKELFVN